MKSIDIYIFDENLRKNILTDLIKLIERDIRIESLIIVGSGAHGWDDAYSDIDLILIVKKDIELLGINTEMEKNFRLSMMMI